MFRRWRKHYRGLLMETVFDWVSVFLFAALIVLFVHRATSAGDHEPDQPIIPYLVGGVGCAVGNYLGNEGILSLAILVLGATILYIFYYLRPIPGWPR